MTEPDPAARLVAAIQGAVAEHAFGTAMKLAEPINAGLFDAAGKPMVMTDASFLASSAGALAAVRQFFGNRWRAGDVAITNDPDAGAANACEMIVVAPPISRPGRHRPPGRWRGLGSRISGAGNSAAIVLRPSIVGRKARELSPPNW